MGGVGFGWLENPLQFCLSLCPPPPCIEQVPSPGAGALYELFLLLPCFSLDFRVVRVFHVTFLQKNGRTC